MGSGFQYGRPADLDADGQGFQPLCQTLPGASRLNEANLATRSYRIFRLALLIFGGVLVTLLLYPVCGTERRLALKASWSAALLETLGLEIEADLRHAVPGALLLANHISWIDVFVINAVLPAAFVAKEDVRRWPLAGWLAARNETIFLRRGSRAHTRVINQEIADILATGKHVAIFPEGTTSDGRNVLHFHAALIQPALVAGCPVLPTALSYWEPDGTRSLAPRYDGSISFGQCTWAVVGRRRLVARLSTTPPLGLDDEGRRQVAARAREAIASAAGLPLPSNSPDIPCDLPDARQLKDLPTDNLSPAPTGLA